jgi:CubicO group peptidase (beta-lactamase class C family)
MMNKQSTNLPRLSRIGALVARLALVTACAALPSTAYAEPGVSQDISPQILDFDVSALEARVRATLDPLAASSKGGYAVTLIKGGKLVHGWAHGSARPGVPWTIDTPTNIGSNAKVLSTLLLLKVFESKSQVKSVEQWLATPIVPYLPRVWRQFAQTAKGPQYDTLRGVTFRDLLTHTSGWGADTLANTLFGRIKQGIDPQHYGVRTYHNMNFTIITYLLPRVINTLSSDTIDDLIEAGGISPDDPLGYGKQYGAYFGQKMQAMLFGKVTGGGIKPSCDPAVDYGKSGRVWAYSLAPFTTPTWSETAKNGGCHAQGGYYISMLELAKLWATYLASEQLLSNPTKKLMYHKSIHHLSQQPNPLGWALAWSGFLKQNFGMDGYPAHNGAQDGAKSSMILLPHGYMMFIGTNMGDAVSAAALPGLSKDAFGDAVQANFP